MKKLYTIGAMACLFAACKPSVKVSVPLSAGKADFRNYLAIGNSLTAGYADNSLYVTGQLNSYPRRLFEQFTLLGERGAEGNFYQPLLHADMGYPGPRKVVSLVYNCNGDSSVAPIDLPSFSADLEDAKPYVSNGPNGQINNIGVPGIRVADYTVNGYGALNPYAARFYSNTGATWSPKDELRYRVINLQTTFFTMWLGSNDVLGFATAGGQGDGSGNALPVSGNYYSTVDITPLQVFKDNFDSAVAISTSRGARGALISIPDISSIPFFTTIPIKGLYISRRTLADSLTAKYASVSPVFDIGYNHFIVEDHAGGVRQAVPGELVLLTCPQDSILCAGWGSFKPIPRQYVITTGELQDIRNATTRFNEHIKAVADRYKLAYVDMFAYMGTLKSGITYNGIKYNAEFISGGAFSLDGVHLTPRGYALVANKILEEINKYYEASIPMIDANKYSGIMFP